MPPQLMLPRLDDGTLTDLRARYDATDDADLRLR
jgi:hypothetical protein